MFSSVIRVALRSIVNKHRPVLYRGASTVEKCGEASSIETRTELNCLRAGELAGLQPKCIQQCVSHAPQVLVFVVRSSEDSFENVDRLVDL
jgi:hypothetical protein